MISEEKKIEIYYDHYKDTFQYQIKYLENRNRYFLSSLVLVTLLFFVIVEPNVSKEINESYLKIHLDKTIKIDFAYFNHFLLFSLMWVLILYFQSTLTIEKNYKYINILEDGLTKEMSPLIISREGKFYSGEKPFFVKAIGYVYKYLYPLSIVTSIFFKLVFEIKEYHYGQLKIQNLIIDIFLCLLIIFITSKYVRWQYQNKRIREKNKIAKVK